MDAIGKFCTELGFSKNQQPAIILCGDLNSQPDIGYDDKGEHDLWMIKWEWCSLTNAWTGTLLWHRQTCLQSHTRSRLFISPIRYLSIMLPFAWLQSPSGSLVSSAPFELLSSGSLPGTYTVFCLFLMSAWCTLHRLELCSGVHIGYLHSKIKLFCCTCSPFVFVFLYEDSMMYGGLLIDKTYACIYVCMYIYIWTCMCVCTLWYFHTACRHWRLQLI